jgi:Xaa-Pro dipeptidase
MHPDPVSIEDQVGIAGGAGELPAPSAADGGLLDSGDLDHLLSVPRASDVWQTVQSGAPPADAGVADLRLEREARLGVLRVRMRERGISVVALASPENIYYLTGLDHLGYFSFTMLLVAVDTEPTLVSRAMEAPTIRAQLPGYRHVTFGDGMDPAAAVIGVLDDMVQPGQVLAMETQAMFFPPLLYDRIRTSLPGVIWMDSSDLLNEQRAVKSPYEIDQARLAARVSDRALMAGLEAARPGVREYEVAAAIQHALLSAGGQQPGFPPLVRSTEMLDQEHVTWGPQSIIEGQGLFLELSGCVRRYHAPLSRTVYINAAPPGARDAAGRALAGLYAALAALGPGALTGEVYAAWQREVTGPQRVAGPLRHHCGYLIGIGFPPSWVGGGEVPGIRPGGQVEIKVGMTFHLMSWIRDPLPHVVSDTALITADGAELLTNAPRDLTVPLR